MSLRTALTMDDGWRTGTTSPCSAAPRWRRPGSSSIVQVGILTFLCVFSDRKWCLVPPWWTMPWSFNALSTTEGSLCYICGAPIHSCSSSDIASCLQAASLKAGTCVSSVRCIHCRNVLNIRSIASWAWLPDDAGGSNLYHHLVVKLNVRTLLWWLDCSYWGQMFGGSISRFQDGRWWLQVFRISCDRTRVISFNNSFLRRRFSSPTWLCGPAGSHSPQIQSKDCRNVLNVHQHRIITGFL